MIDYFKRQNINYLIVFILLLGLFLRFNCLDFQSVWLDELHTLNEANPNVPLSQLYGAIMLGEQMPPLYFYILYFIFKIFGYTELIARLFSAVLGVVSIYALYILAKEIFNKKIALISALLLAINSFHLYYSQEARPYILLFLFSILSFYGLSVYLKNPNIKNAIKYGAFSGLMLLSHFFGLFVVFAQLFILLFFFLISEKDTKFFFIKNTAIAGGIMILLFLPALKIFIKVSEIKEFWITPPTEDSYTLVFKEFFGNSEMILSLIGVFILMYFWRLSKESNSKLIYSEIIKNKTLFGFIILLPWVSLVLLVPMIRSYMSVPMIISRYFIVILPALLLIIAVGITQFRNQTIRIGFISLLFIFSMSDIFFVKKYYKTHTKSQFREASNFILKNNKENDSVYSSLAWYFGYFIKDNITHKPLDFLVDEIKSDATKQKSFWYVNAHNNTYSLNEANQQFISENYVIDKNFEGLDAWAKRFVPKKIFEQKINLEKYKPFSENQYGKEIKAWIEKFELVENNLKLSGWSFLKNINSDNNHIYIVLLGENKEVSYITNAINRPDITTFINDGNNYDKSGFELNTNLNKLSGGTYKLAILITNKTEEGLFITDKQIRID